MSKFGFESTSPLIKCWRLTRLMVHTLVHITRLLAHVSVIHINSESSIRRKNPSQVIKNISSVRFVTTMCWQTMIIVTQSRATFGVARINSCQPQNHFCIPYAVFFSNKHVTRWLTDDDACVFLCLYIRVPATIVRTRSRMLLMLLRRAGGAGKNHPTRWIDNKSKWLEIVYEDTLELLELVMLGEGCRLVMCWTRCPFKMPIHLGCCMPTIFRDSIRSAIVDTI